MLAAQRRDLLLERLATQGRVVAKDLAAELGLSEDSIRRDLRELAAEGLCKKVYGGALPIARAEADYAGRQRVEPASKVAVAQRAAGLIQPGMTAILDGGTTTLAVARALPHNLNATIVTHSPTIAAALVEHPSVDVYVIGGRLFKHSIVAMGPSALEAIAQIRTDIYFMGVCSLHPQSGISTGDFDEAGIKRAISNMAQRTVVLASPEKLDTASPYQIAPLSQISAIIVNSDVPEALVKPYRKMGIAITRA